MRKINLILLLASVSLFTACSQAIEFIVVNESDHPIQIRCKVMDLPGDPVAMIGPLSVTNASQLRAGNSEWRELSNGGYQVDHENRTVTVSTMPGEALLVKRVHWSDMKDGEPMSFSIEAITITGASGEIMLQGRQVSKAFVQEKNQLYTFTYK